MLKPSPVNFESEPAERPAAPGSGSFWTITYYQPLFDVDTMQVVARVRAALLPRPKGAFFELVAANPDLYGPFWIATTLIFTMAMTGNLASYFAFKPSPQHPLWTYNFNQLTLAGSVIYAYVTLLPLLFWMVLRYYEASKKLVDVLCIYGYTLSIFMPISVACVLSSNMLRWLLNPDPGNNPNPPPRSSVCSPPTCYAGCSCWLAVPSRPSSSSPTSTRTSPIVSRMERGTRSARPTCSLVRWPPSTSCSSSSSRSIFSPMREWPRRWRS